MKRTRFTDEQIIGLLIHQVVDGLLAPNLGNKVSTNLGAIQ